MHSILEKEVVKASKICLNCGAFNFCRSHSVGDVELMVKSMSLSNHRKLDITGGNLEPLCCRRCDIVTHQLHISKMISESGDEKNFSY